MTLYCPDCMLTFFTRSYFDRHMRVGCHIKRRSCVFRDLSDLVKLCEDIDRILELEEFAMEIAPSLFSHH